MCSYNAVNGIPSCANTELLTDYAREKWGFEGYITGDCGAVEDVLSTHHYAKNNDDNVNITLSAGTDIDCGGFYSSHLGEALSDGGVTRETVNKALFN